MKNHILIVVLLIITSCSSPEIGNEPAAVQPTATEYTLTINAGTGGAVSTSGGNYEDGSTVSVTATPNTGYVFENWSNGSTENTISVTVSSNQTITAYFTQTQSSNVNRTIHSIIPKNHVSSNPEEVSSILTDIPHQTIYFKKNSKETLLIGPNDYLDVYGERPMKHFIKENGNWIFLNEYLEFQDGGPRDFESFDDGRLALASHGLETPVRQRPLGYLWELSGIGTDDLRFKKISPYKAFWHNVAVGDLNRDNIQDVVSVQMGNNIGDFNPFHIFLGKQNQNYEKIDSDNFFEVNSGILIPEAGSIAINDIDNDGNIDIVLAAYVGHIYSGDEQAQGDLYGQKYGIEIYSDTDGNGRFEKINYDIPLGSFEYVEMGASGIKIEDLNLDGNLDMVLFYEGNIDPSQAGIPPYDNLIDVFLSNGDKSFNVSTIFAKSQTEVSAREFVLIDVDNDGDKDIALKSWQFGIHDGSDVLNLDLRNPNDESNVLNFSPLIYLNENGVFNRVSKDLTIQIVNLETSYFIPIKSDNQFRYLQVSTPYDDYMSISEYTFDFSN